METATQTTAAAQHVLSRWRAMPRATRWACIAALGIVAYFAAVEPSLNAMNRWTASADSKERNLRDFAREAASRKDRDRAASLGVTRFGVVEGPGDAAERSLALNRKVNEILDANGIKRPTTTTRVVPMSAGSPLVKHMGSDYKVERLINDVEFTAEPEQVAKVVAALEQAREVSAIGSLQIRQGNEAGSRLVKATVAVESWQFRKKERAK